MRREVFTNMKKESTYKKQAELGESISKLYSDAIDSYFKRSFSLIENNGCFRCGVKKGHTEACIKEQKAIDKKNKAYEKRESIRRAKKITITVGEYEDLQNNSDPWDY